ALIDVFEGKLTLRIGKYAITFNLDQTSRYSANYNDMMANRIDVIDMASLEDGPTSSKINQSYVDTEGDVLLLEAILNDDPSSPSPNQGNYLPQVELKDLPPHLEYVFLEGDDKLPVIIARDLSDEEKIALITVLKSYKRAIASKLSNIKSIDPEFCTHKILIEEDFEPVEFISNLSLLFRKELKRCEDDNLCLNWEKSHFKVKEGIILDHKISKVGIEVDKAKADVITKLPDPTTVKGNAVLTEKQILKGCEALLLIKSSKGVYTARKPLTFSRLAAMDPPRDITAQITLPRRKVQLNELNELRDQAYEKSLIYKKKTKRLHDSKIKDCVFNIGDRVLLFNSRLKIFSGKLKFHWSGPFTISPVFPYGNVKLSQPDGPNFKHDLCKLVIAEFANNSSVIGGERFCFNPFRQVVDGYEPIEFGVKHLLGSVIWAVMSLGGSIAASLENVNGFLAVYTPLDDLIRSNASHPLRICFSVGTTFP
nr:reverse transcriptase domain-containing protein [Tanacetum cinerariifolium]